MSLVVVFLIGSLGAFVQYLFTPRMAEASASQVLRGSRFELVDNSGKVKAVLECGQAKQPRLRMLSEEGVAIIDVGLTGSGSPYWSFNGADGSSRVVVKIGFGDKPILLMGDRTSPSKLILGSVQSDAPDPTLDTWAVEFSQPPPHRRPVAGINAILGYEGKPIVGSMFVVDLRGRLSTFGDRDAKH
jgi:hypothetical protein